VDIDAPKKGHYAAVSPNKFGAIWGTIWGLRLEMLKPFMKY
jgi:hypothetical protein